MTSKKLFAGILTLAFVVGMVVPAGAGAATAEELQAQIEALQAQLTSLMAQLTDAGGSMSSGDVPAACVGVTFERNLKVGMTGSDVKCLQALLNTADDTMVASSGVGSAGSETEYYGGLTASAVAKFQEKYAEDTLAPWGLTAGTGFFGSTTRAKANDLLVSMPADDGDDDDDVDMGDGDLKVSLSDDTAEAGTVIADTTTGTAGAQSMVPFLSVDFMNDGDGDALITELSFKRFGVASDTNLSQLYLYDGEELLAEYSSFDSGVVVFEDSDGLFEVDDGDTMTVTLKADIAEDTSASRTIGFKLDSASSVESDAESVSGDFPVEGNLMTTTTVSDLGYVTVANSSPSAADTVDPGNDDYDLWTFTMAASDQDMEVSYLKFTDVGSVDDDDLQNLRLVDQNDVQHGDVMNDLDGGTVEFDLSDNPIEIEKGDTDTFYLKGDVAGGTSRTYRFSFQSMSDLVVYDTEYDVYTKPNQADSWTIIQAGGATTINTGTLTISRSADTPSGNIAAGATGLKMATFELTANGEDVKVTSLDVYVTRTTDSDGTNEGLNDVKLILDGSQKDSTRDITGDGSGNATTFSFGNTFTVDAGETAVLTVKADVKDATDGGNIDASDTIQVRLAAGSSNAQGKSSMTAISTAAADGLSLTVASGTMSAAKNNAVPAGSAGVPTGVPGATDVRVASFVVSAGSGEGVTVSSVKVKDSSSAFEELQNVRVETADGTQIGNVQGNATAGSTYTFYASPKISLDASEQVVLNVYADIITGANAAAQGFLILDQVSGIGVDTSSSANYTTDVNGQVIYIASTGALTVTNAADMPVASMLGMSTADVTLGKFKFYETTGGEDVTVTQIIVTEGDSDVVSTINNIRIYDGDTLLGSVADVAANGHMTYGGLSWNIPAGTEKYLTIMADVSVLGAAASDDDIQMTIEATEVTAQGAVSGTAITTAPTADRDQSEFEVWKAVPTITTSGVSLDGGSLGNGANNLYKFQVSAEGNSVDFYTWTFTVATSGCTAGGTWKLYNNTEGVYEDSSCSISANAITCTASSGEQIAAGTTETYTLSNDGMTGVGTAGDNIRVYMASDTSDVGVAAAGSVTGNIVWSDMSNTAHTVSTADWTSGYLLENDDEYTTTQTLSY